MEFTYSEYLVRITLNPNDIIVRFEHNTTYRSYEQTFFDRDFPEASFVGGLEFVGKVLTTAFSSTSKDLKIEDFQKTNTSLRFTVTVTNPLFVTGILLPFNLPAIRKDSGNLDMNVLNRKVKEMNDSLEPRLKQLQEALESRLAIMDTLGNRLKEMEERCGNSITLPGCIFAIPINMTSLVLIRNQTCLPDGRAFSTMMPGYHTSGQYNNNPINWPNIFMGTQQIGYAVSWNPAQDVFAFDKLTSISNVKYLKTCKQITISGSQELADYSTLGEMPWLTHITIISSRQYQNNPSIWVNAGNHPTLRDISWIKNLKSLHSLTLIGCASLSDITPLKDLPNLRELDIRETAVRNTDFLINPNLKITK
jgi:Leucine-rich repeat (LRR) protein